MHNDGKVVPINRAQATPSPLARLPVVLLQVRDKAAQQLQQGLQELFDNADDTLFEMAEKARSTVDHHIFFEAMRDLRLKRKNFERVFMERQRVDLDAVSAGEATTRTLDLTLTVNRTFPGGPLRVAVIDPRTGDPVDAVVKIGREGGESVDVGTTGDDGTLWTVSPRGEFVVTAVEVGSTEVSTVSVTPTDPVTVDEALGSAGDRESPNATE